MTHDDYYRALSLYRSCSYISVKLVLELLLGGPLGPLAQTATGLTPPQLGEIASHLRGSDQRPVRKWRNSVNLKIWKTDNGSDNVTTDLHL